MKMARASLAVVLLMALAAVVHSQQALTGPEAPPWFSDVFPKEEYAARRTAVMQQIGDGVAIVEGAAEKPAEAPFRQNNQFFYLTGVEVPRAFVVIDGRTKRSTLYLPDSTRRARMWGPMLEPDADAARISGIESVVPREQLEAAVAAFGQDSRVIYTPFRPEVLGSGSAGDAAGFARANAQDPWDGRQSREQAFIDHVKARAPQAQLKDLDPIVDGLRFLKSPREIAVIREATRITGLAIVEAMRETAPGKFEYELQAAAEYIFKKHGAQGAAYFALVATGKNTIFSHYHRGMARLADGDLVQFDYAPDYKYYVSDVTRVFPANGKFTAWQREYYTSYLRLYQALMTSIKPNVPVREIIADAVKKMDGVLTTFTFTDPKIRQAATAFVERYRKSTANSLGHTIGMEVHDVTRRTDTLVAGQLFTIEPAMQIPDLGLGLRLEDAILMTETGYENLSASVPVEVEAIEKTMAERGASAPRR
jgi:Xaa-Pro aminopeptidase